ncbi:hypothetical protein CA85_48970 [Allorhodopirellula solitaria]|uniref:Uncharacterized protein n=1 Tax=Allorhodopirellula solitaria TaxID=2527987 RepID=A0A5C5WX02_9BACT|nr:hypothetical protein CA85_48970 [Allorhodopirellula solitaria]
MAVEAGAAVLADHEMREGIACGARACPNFSQRVPRLDVSVDEAGVPSTNEEVLRRRPPEPISESNLSCDVFRT